MEMFHLRLQTGASPDHSPSAWQTLLLSPNSLNPLLQEYVALEPNVDPVRRTCPSLGLARLPQSTANKYEAVAYESAIYIATETEYAYVCKREHLQTILHWLGTHACCLPQGSSLCHSCILPLNQRWFHSSQPCHCLGHQDHHSPQLQ